MNSMALSKKIILVSALFFVFLSFFQSCSADDIINITISDLESTVEIIQGKCKSHPFEIYNAYNDSVLIYYRIDKPSDMDIISSPEDYTLLELGETIDGILYICIDESFPENSYNIKFWVEAMTRVEETGSYRKSNVRSEKYIIEVIVLNDPEITTTTSTISETTTTSIQTTQTIPEYPPVTTTTTKRFDIEIDKPKTGSSLDRGKLVMIGIIVILLILIMLPYFTFIKGRKAKTEAS